MDAYIDAKIKSGPLDELDAALRLCWSAEDLDRLYQEISQDAKTRLAQISTRIDRLRGS